MRNKSEVSLGSYRVYSQAYTYTSRMQYCPYNMRSEQEQELFQVSVCTNTLVIITSDI